MLGLPPNNGHKIIRNGVALVGEGESVSGVHRAATGRGIVQENPPMRIYIIANDGITLCREAPAAMTEGGDWPSHQRRNCTPAPAQRQTASGTVECSPRGPRSAERSATARR